MKKKIPKLRFGEFSGEWEDNLSGYYVFDKNDFVYNPRISKHAPVGPLKRNNYKRGVMSPLYTVLKPKIEFLDFLEKYFDTIANFLTALDNQIEGQNKGIEKAELWKKGLMQGLFA